jgi:glutathionyl-hydroquinone reductase
MKISLLEVILRQVNEIFVNSLYNKDTPTLINSANSSVNILREQVTEQYISNSKELNELMPIPGVEELAAWVEEIHYDISRQLYSEGFCNTVILPALQTITESIIEFAQEENENENKSEVEE